MWKTIWKCISVPVIAIKTGQYGGYPVSRNPLTWIGMWAYGLLLIPFTIFIYPFLLFFLWVGFITYDRKGGNASVTNEGISVERNNWKDRHLYKWEQISEVTLEFEAPCFYPGLKLHTGELIHLYNASAEEISQACRRQGIKAYETVSRKST